MPEYNREVYAAIDKLNSWVRSESARGWWSSPRHAIYDWKNHLIETAIRNCLSVNHAIYLTLTCRDCGGTGRYEDSYGTKFDHCRKCFNKGVQRLQFLVTETHGFTWHTPRDKAWRFQLSEEFWKRESLSVDWEPNAKGRDLGLIELVQLLNFLEPVMPKPGSHAVADRWDYYGEADHGKYKLNLRELSKEHVCQFCGAMPPPDEDAYKHGHYHGVVLDHFEWSAWACTACKEKFPGVEIFARFSLPDIAAHPEIQKWLSRRPVAKDAAA